MNREIYAVTLHAMQNDAKRLENIGVNLNGAQVTGFKRHITFQDVFQRNFSASLSMQTDSVQSARDNAQGLLRQTGQALDFAINGEGYFAVRTPNGVAYTRNGQFTRNQQGLLASKEGYPVLSRLGGDIQLDKDGNVALAKAGLPVTDVNQVDVAGQLKLVKFKPNALNQNSHGDYLYASQNIEAIEVDYKNSSIEQGKLESANVQTVHEMMQLMQVMRHFESMQKITQNYDELVGAAIKKFGEVN